MMLNKEKDTFVRPPPCPVFDPTIEEFADPYLYIQKISPIAEKYGICKIRPPLGWRVPFAINDKSFTFTPRVINLGDLCALNRVKYNFISSLIEFWELQNIPVYETKIKDVQIDYYNLHKAVKSFGGFEKAKKDKKWPEIARLIGVDCSGPSVSSLIAKYKKILLPYDNFIQSNNTDSKNINSKESIKVQTVCINCKEDKDEELLVKCECCGPSGVYHIGCLDPPLSSVPKNKWRCKSCISKEFNRNCNNVYGFNPSKKRYTLQRFGMQANDFKSKYFGKNYTTIDYEECEREFWHLINDEKTSLCVEYGADLSAKNVGSGFPTKYRNKNKTEEKEFIESKWNLNKIALLEDSALRFIPKYISGMIIPWVYIGMCFSCFCWHIEDHWCYSINYMHMGEPKTWYGIPSYAADQFEDLMKREAGDLFNNAPDLLHHMTTMFDPTKIAKEGIPVYRADQFPGEFMLTFPRAYHAGFNQGFNCAEAVNFCPSDWFKHGQKCIESYASVYRPTVFSHDELLCRMACLPSDLNADFLLVVIEQLQELLVAERQLRKKTLDFGIRKTEKFSFEDFDEERRECEVCKTTLFTSAICCSCDDERVTCLNHYKSIDCCQASDLSLLYRYTLDEFTNFISELQSRLEDFNVWNEKVAHLLTTDDQTSKVKADPDEKPNNNYLTLDEIKELHQVGIKKKYPKRLIIQLTDLIKNIENCCQLARDMIEQCDIYFDEGFVKNIFNTKESVVEDRKSFKKPKKSLKNVPEPKSNNSRKLSLDELGEFVLVFRKLPCNVEEKDRLDQFVDSIKKWQTESRKLLSNTENHLSSDKEDMPDWLTCVMKEPESFESENPLHLPPLLDEWKEIFSTIPTTCKLGSLINFADKVCVDLPELKSLKRISNCVSWLERTSNSLKLNLFAHKDVLSVAIENDDAISTASTMDTGHTESVVTKSDVDYQNDLLSEDEAKSTQNESSESEIITTLQKLINSNEKISLTELVKLQEESLMLSSTHSIISLTFHDNETEEKPVKKEDSKDASLLNRLNYLDLAVMFLKKRLDYSIRTANVYDAEVEKITKSLDKKMSLHEIYILLENLSSFPIRLANSSSLLNVMKTSYCLHKRLETLTWYLSMHFGIDESTFNITDANRKDLAVSLSLDASSRSKALEDNNYEPEKILSRVNRSIVLWKPYIDHIRDKTVDLPVTFCALTKLEKIIKVIDDCKIDLANTFVRLFSNGNLVEILLPRPKSAIEILTCRDEIKNRSTIARNKTTGPGNRSYGSSAYVSALRENAKIFVSNLLNSNDIEEVYNKCYQGFCDEEVKSLRQLRMSNNLKSGENDQDKVVYCICRQPGYQGLMLQCEVCKDWFHNRCVAFPTKELDMSLVRFVCPRCQRTSRPEILNVLPILDRMRAQIVQIYIDSCRPIEQADQVKKESEEETEQTEEKAPVISDEERNLSEAISQYLSASPEIACVQLLIERVRHFQEKIHRFFTTDLELTTFLKHFEQWFGVKFQMDNLTPEQGPSESCTQLSAAFDKKNLANKPKMTGNFILGNRLGNDQGFAPNQRTEKLFNVPPYLNRQNIFQATNFPLNRFPSNNLLSDFSSFSPSGTLISLTTATATANANFARKNVRKSPLEARSQMAKTVVPPHIPDMSSKIGMGYGPRNSDTNVAVKRPLPQDDSKLNQQIPKDNSPQRFKYRLPQSARDILDELLFESCLIELNIPMTRWLWQMRIACDSDSDSMGAKCPLRMKPFEDSVNKRANRIRIQMWEKGLLPSNCLDGVMGGIEPPIPVDQNTTQEKVPKQPTQPAAPSKGFTQLANKGKSLINGMKRKYSKLTSTNRKILKKDENAQSKSHNPDHHNGNQDSLEEENDLEKTQAAIDMEAEIKTPVVSKTSLKQNKIASERSQRTIKKPDPYRRMSNPISDDYVSNDSTPISHRALTKRTSNVRRGTSATGRRRNSFIGSRGSAVAKKAAKNTSSPCQAGKLCQRPKEDLVQWICCDLCEQWYHMICVGIKTEAPDGEYLCPICVQLRNDNLQNEDSSAGPAVLFQAFDVLQALEDVN